jgi:hypothetical protein
MDAPPPPPPPPHGANPNTTEGTKYRKSTDLPDGNYDIFIIPPHSAGSGFIYLPSLQCHRNSFIAGSLSTLLAVVIWMAVLPTVKSWFATTVATGGMGIIVLVIAVGALGWFWGVSQAEGGPTGGSRGGRPASGFGPGSGPGSPYNRGQNFGGTFAEGGSNPGAQYPGNQYSAGGPPPQSAPPPPPPPHNTQGTNKADSEWERAREETKRKEEIRRKMEEYKKRRQAEEMEKKKEREKEALEKELREKKQKEAAEKERLAKEKAEREAAEKEAAAKEAAKKEAAARFAAAKEAAAKKFAAAKEAAAKEAAAKASPKTANSTAPRTPSPKKPPQASAKTAEDDAYSFRPYDRPRRPYTTSAPSVYSESSYAPSQSTARTTPPPSHRGPYYTKDPDKVIIQGVYAFNNAFMKTPIAQLVSGQGSVTDGLVLRITTEGLFIDDDVRGVAQREWDVKAWTMKLVEVCSALADPTKRIFFSGMRHSSSLTSSDWISVLRRFQGHGLAFFPL